MRYRRKNGSKLKWYRVKNKLYKLWKGDILLILDCCHAEAASRGTEGRTIELLAASGISETAPGAGTKSFTSILIRILKKHASSKPPLTVEGIHDLLMKKYRKDSSTPVHNFIQGSHSIYLIDQTLKSSKSSKRRN